MMTVKKITTVEDFNKCQGNNGLTVVHFMTEWVQQCNEMNEVLLELNNVTELKDVTFVSLNAEDLAEVSLKYKVSAVPTFILLRSGKEVERVDGANASELTIKVKTQAAKASLLASTPSAPVEDLNSRLKRLVNSAKCVLFMKGSAEEPKCGFSRTTIELLNKHTANYSTFDILSDEEVRQGLKTFSNWPTYPQLYINGELIGGLDILKEMDSMGELEKILPKKLSLEDRLKELVNQAPLMAFIKGSPSSPKCGFSRTLVDILAATGLPYESFDILSDEEVRLGLKTFSDWPTYPQVYVKGELIGGLDIIKEMKANGELEKVLTGQ